MSSSASRPSRNGRARRVAFAVVAAVATLLTGFLTVGSVGQLVSPAATDGERIAFLVHLPWLGLGWCAAFAVQLRRPERRPAALQQALGMLAGLYVAGFVLARESDPVFYVGFGAVVGLLVLLHPDRRSVFRAGPHGVSPLLVPLSLVVAAPLALYAVQMVRLADDLGPDGPFYVGVAATAVAVPLVGLVAGLRSAGSRLPAWSAGVMCAGLGVASLLWSGDPGALPVWGAALALLAGVAFVVLGEWERRRSADLGEPGLRTSGQASRDVMS